MMLVFLVFLQLVKTKYRHVFIKFQCCYVFLCQYQECFPTSTFEVQNFFSRYEIRDPHMVEESVLQILKEKADFDSYKPRPFNMREFYDRTGHDIKDMLLSCFYRGTECSAEDFKVVSQACRRLNVLCRASLGLPK